MAGLKEEILITLQIVSDLSYAWEIVDPAFTDEMQMGLKKDPSLVGKLRSTFLKV
jgi:WASH complex subunit strumpellin